MRDFISLCPSIGVYLSGRLREAIVQGELKPFPQFPPRWAKIQRQMMSTQVAFHREQIIKPRRVTACSPGASQVDRPRQTVRLIHPVDPYTVLCSERLVVGTNEEIV
jgi:hypothetical protein